MRLVVYDDQIYRRGDGELWTERTLPGFLAELTGSLDALVLLGRLEAAPPPWNFRLPDDVSFEALPSYGSLADARAVLAATVGSVRVFDRAVRNGDAALLFGPHPLSLVFAAVALVRRRPVILGVRQELRRYARSRHPGRRSMHLAADALEWSWRTLARRRRTVVVGPELGRQYGRSKSLLVLHVSLIRESEIAGADLEQSRAWDGELEILSVGRLDAEKNPLLLADVLARLNHAEPGRWRLTICGTGPLHEALATRLRELGLEHQAILAGYVPAGDELMAFYRRSHAFLHISWTEGVPQVLFEAFAAALPVVATAVGGVPEAVRGGAGLLVEPGDAEAPARALERLASEPELRQRLVRCGIERVGEHTLEAEIARLAEFILAAALSLRA
jgi:glycosyltransferase involved in cell wall biosynthesis